MSHQNLNYNSLEFQNQEYSNEFLIEENCSQSSQKPFNSTISREDIIESQNFQYATHFIEEKPKDAKARVMFKKRKIQIIQTCINHKQKHYQCEKGDRYQTKNHCKHLFTELSRFFKIMKKANEITEQERPFIESFLKQREKINIKRFNKLSTNHQLRSKCLQFLQSNDLPIHILSSRAILKNKLILLKYLEEFRRICITGEVKKWKDKC